MAIEIVDLPIENGGSFHSFLYVHQAGYSKLEILAPFFADLQRLRCHGTEFMQFLLSSVVQTRQQRGHQTHQRPAMLEHVSTVWVFETFFTHKKVYNVQYNIKLAN